MRNLKFLLFVIHVNFIFSDNLWEHEPTGWGYDQTTQQCFYMFMDMQITSSNDIQIIGVGDGANIEQSQTDNNGDGLLDSECGLTDECDAIGSFIIHTKEKDGNGNPTGTPMTYSKCQEIEGTTLWNDDFSVVEGCELCIGVGYFNSDPENVTTVLAMGISPNHNDQKLHYYATSGDSITFKLYDASLNTISNLSISSTSSSNLHENGLDPWAALELFLYIPDSLSFVIDLNIGCTDPNANNYDLNAEADDGSCTYASGCTDSSACNYDSSASVDNGSCEYVVDCEGQCGGDADVDDCGVCNGGNADMDCEGVCFGDAVLDVCGDCAGEITDANDCPEGDNDNFIVYELEISNIYPNPFNPATNITYSIDHYSKVKIDIYSIDGKIVSNLVNSYQSHGLYTINWNPNITAGIYFVKMRVGLFSDTKKIIYIK